ncbi:MAG: NTP transferase domain-containing protein [Candidatus Aenigmarchaeota archaeon]|nr:NTP transferase domain-containing protein [Candidatus Aenigmarchaeota archaeon]
MQAVVLAAGESSRYWPLNKRHKSLTTACGKTMLEWTVDSIKSAGIPEKDIVVIQGPGREIEFALSSKLPGLKYVVQLEPKGMGDAVMQAENHIRDAFVVLNPNHPDAAEVIDVLKAKKEETGAGMVLMGQETNTPELYGVFDLEKDKAKAIVEKPETGKAPSNIRVVGSYLLPKDFFGYYKRVPEHMYAFEDALSLHMKEKDTRVALTKKDMISVKYPWHRLKIREELLKKKKDSISKTAKIAKGVIIENSHIGENVKIFENSVIKNSYIGDNSIIGNFSLVRDTTLETGCLIGAHSEVAKSAFQEDVHMHSGYIGDTAIGAHSRIGAGVITANVRLDRGEIFSVVKGKKKGTGLTSFGCIIGENVKMGINTSTMPGVLIGNNCIIGPGVIVKENLPDGSKVR